MAIGSTPFLHAQSNNTPVSLPADFPKYVNTGNPQADNQRYNAAKSAWIANNKVAYNALNSESRPNSSPTDVLPTNPPTSELLMPIQPKQDLPYPKMTTSGKSEAVLPLQTNENKQININADNRNIPLTTQPEQDLPYLRTPTTGNPEADAVAYIKAKNEWIKQHPDEYKQMGGNLEVVMPSQTNENQQANVNTSKINKYSVTQPEQDLPYPKIVVTGNPEADEAAHIKSKSEWIKQHPEQYRQMGGNPEVILSPQTNKNQQEDAKISAVNMPPFEAIKKYKLILYEAVAAPDLTVNKQQIEAENENLRKKGFIGYDTELHIRGNHEIRLYETNKMDLRAIETRANGKVTWFFENKECETCSKNLYLTIEEETNETITYIMQSEDDNSLFAYRMSFHVITKP